MKTIESQRQFIDQLDKKIVKFLVRRLGCSLLLSNLKLKQGLKLKDKKREAQIYRNIRALSAQNQPQFKKEITEIYHAILKASRRVQRPRAPHDSRR